MINITLDSNIYDLIDVSKDTKKTIRLLIDTGVICIHAPEHVIHELENSPFNGLPDWFVIEEVRDSVFVAGITPYGNGTLGGGRVFDEHLGDSKKYDDAIIADTAHSSSDILVTNDGRFNHRFAKASKSCKVLNFSEFEVLLEKLINV